MNYYYLISSLPMLQFGMKPVISYNDFISNCREQLTPSDMDVINRATIAPCEEIEDESPALREWKHFEVSLRNELARSRAGKKGKEAVRYIRGENSPDPFTAPFAHWAISQKSPLEAEHYLDKIRWEKIEDLKKGHYFDITCLIAYALQLQILERWKIINSGDGMQALEEIVNL